MSDWLPEEKDRLLNTLEDIANDMQFAAKALTRQADVMEADIEAERENIPKDVEDALEKQFFFITDKYVQHIHSMGVTLDSLITATYLNDMERAKAIRNFQQMLVKFEALEIKES